MSKTTLNKGLYVITEYLYLDFETLQAKTELILQKGIEALQYRNKDASRDKRLVEAKSLQDLCKTYNTSFIINDDIDVATELDADGIHLGRDDMSCQQARKLLGEDKIIGVSCYNELDRAEQAVEDGADYIAFGAMFPSNTKQDTVKASPDIIKTAKHKYNVKVAAIGGITPVNCLPVIHAGADLIAVISSVYLSDDPGIVIDNFNLLMSTN